MTPHEVTLRGVTKRFGSGAVPVFEDIHLAVERGEFVTFLGPSGCGKSTLLKMVAGLTSCSSGEIRMEALTQRKARAVISFVFQDAMLLPWRTVEGNIALGLELEGKSKAEIAAEVEKLLQLVGLAEVGKRYPRQLSGGMKMRVSIARALATRPRLLLMDEPFAALDEMTRDRMNEELLRLRAEQNWTVMFVTHSVAEAVFLSSRIIVLAPPRGERGGRIAHEIAVDLPYPRTTQTRDSAEYNALVSSTSKLLREAHRS